MRTLISLLGLLLLTPAFADDAPAQPTSAAPAKVEVHRFVVERTFPAGALDNLDAATKAKVNANNASVGVQWLLSYANAEKTKTYCVYEGPNENAIRTAAKLNNLPVDHVTEVPVTLSPK
jgi:Nickel responsive protein SCO4226-like